jgi:hypothetical protein
MPMYGKASQIQIAMIQQYAAQSKATVKRTNMKPPQIARYPEYLLFGKAKGRGVHSRRGLRVIYNCAIMVALQEAHHESRTTRKYTRGAMEQG